MADFTKIKTADFAGRSFDCGCGKTHTVGAKKIIIGENALLLLGDAARGILPAGKVLFITRQDSFKPVGEKILSRLEGAGYAVETFITEYGAAGDAGALLSRASENVKMAVCYGDADVCDIAKHFCLERDAGLIVIPDTPCCCRALWDFSAEYSGGLKRYVKTVCPDILLCDLSVAGAAPSNVIAAAFGELCSYITALFDMYFAHVIHGGHYCRRIADMIIHCVDICLQYESGLISKRPEAVYALCEAAVRCSLAGLMAGEGIVGAQYYAADIIGLTNKDFLYGESAFIAHHKIYNLYKLFLESEVCDILPPSDKALHARYLSGIAQIDEYEALLNINYDASCESYKITRYKTEEYRQELTGRLNENYQRAQSAWVLFKRIYGDAGYHLSQRLKTLDAGSALAVCCDCSDIKCALGHIRNMGLLEKYLQHTK
jgi:glycerol dehydrogenase-like iron-containing ADH family enzyme